MKKLFLPAPVSIFVLNANAQSKKDLKELRSWMIGHFSSARQNQTATFLTSARQFTRCGITKDGMITLDMGFNANDEQV